MKHPMQKIHIAPDGAQRFVDNKIVRHVLDWATEHGHGLNEIARHCRWDHDDWEQFYQLIGYSVSGCPYKFETTRWVAYALAAGEATDERDARIQALEEMLAGAREASIALSDALGVVDE